jgi:hypothetical protein
MSCECECQLELEKLSQENKTIQKTLLQIRLIVENLTTERKDEKIKRRERTW